MFGFFSNLKSLEAKEIKVHCKTFTKMYNKDFYENK